MIYKTDYWEGMFLPGDFVGLFIVMNFRKARWLLIGKYPPTIYSISTISAPRILFQ